MCELFVCLLKWSGSAVICCISNLLHMRASVGAAGGSQSLSGLPLRPSIGLATVTHGWCRFPTHASACGIPPPPCSRCLVVLLHHCAVFGFVRLARWSGRWVRVLQALCACHPQQTVVSLTGHVRMRDTCPGCCKRGCHTVVSWPQERASTCAMYASSIPVFACWIIHAIQLWRPGNW